MARGLVIALSLALGACSSTGGLFGGGNSAANSANVSADAQRSDDMDPRGLAVYLDMMRMLIEGDSLTQVETFRSVADSADFAPTTTNRLKYALAMAVPGHNGSNAELAEQQLSALLAAADALLPEERVLATIQLRDVEQRLVLDAASERLRQEMASAIAQQNAASASRVQALLDENQRLQAELDEATAKLDAITSIEQSIREREDSVD